MEMSNLRSEVLLVQNEVQVQPPLDVHMDASTSLGERDSSCGEEESESPLDGSTISMLCHGNTDQVLEWLESIGCVNVERGKTNDFEDQCMVTLNKALQVAVQHNKMSIAKLLLEHGANVGVRDGDQKTLLHMVCDCPQEEDTMDMVKMLLQKDCLVNAEDEDKNTPLHYAAENGHTMSVIILLDAGAKLDARNDLDDSPVHAAAENGHLEVIDEMIKRVSGCVHYRGFQRETPLHDACCSGYVKVALRLLEMGADVGALSDIGETPLHKAAESSSVAVVKLLLDEGAEVNPKTDAKRSPLAKACYFGHMQVVNVLLERGADVKPKALEDAIKEGYEHIAHALLQSPQWPKAMRHTFTYEGKQTTPFRQLIRKMPGVAKNILDKCTVSSPSCPEPGDIRYSVLFNYEFVEDFQDEKHDSDDEKRPKRRKKFDEKQTYGCGYMDVRQAKSENFTTSWGPVGFSKDRHPLQLMVCHKRLDLLKHPLVGSLLHYKWKTFSRSVYFVNLLSYALFVLVITTFAMTIPNPQSCQCYEGHLNHTNTTEESFLSDSNGGSQMYISITAGAVILCASFRLLFELIQLCVLRLRFILNWANIMEIVLFVFSIIYAWIFHSPCMCPKPWQWQIGAIAVFLAWFDLILFFAKFPQIGIYSLIFVKILSTFFKAVFVSALLVIAFALALHMSFFEPSIMRSPFTTPARSLLKTISMTTGEQEFDSIFHQEASGGRDELDEIPFLPVSFLMWILFIVFIPILLTNMLVGLAVGDIQDIYDEASLKKLSLQVEQVLTFEELLPTKLRRKFVTGFKEVFPNQKPTIMKHLQNLFWDGEPYDTKRAINSALRPPLDASKDVQKNTDKLVQDIEDIKHSLAHMQGHSKKTRQDLSCVTKDISAIQEVQRSVVCKNRRLLSEVRAAQLSLQKSQAAIAEIRKALQQMVNKKQSKN